MKSDASNCGCCPMGECDDARRLRARLGIEKAGVSVLAHSALMKQSMERAQAEVRLRRQTETVNRLGAELAQHERLSLGPA